MKVLPVCFLLTLGLTPNVLAQVDHQPGTSAPYATCIWYNSVPVPGVAVTVQSSVISGTGYHNHTAGRPQGSINSPSGTSITTVYTGGDGCANFTWYAPNAAGQYGLLAYSSYGSDALNINVWVPPFTGQLFVLPPGADYTLVGSNSNHTINNWGTGNTVLSLQLIMQQFKVQTGVVAAINDIGLPWGGTFDLGPSYATANCPASAAAFWVNTCVHAEHRFGRNVDIPTAALGSYVSTFLTLATYYGGASGAGILNEGNHYHLRFAY